MCLCCGDGFAEVFGKRFGVLRLPWSASKTWCGSCAFVVATVISVGTIDFFIYQNFPGFEKVLFWDLFTKTLVTSVLSAAVESIHNGDADNLIIFLCAVTFYSILFNR